MKPIRSRLVRTLVLFAIAAWPGLALAAYVFTSIDYPNAVFTDVRGINNVGQVDGTTSVDGIARFPFVYNAGTYTPWSAARTGCRRGASPGSCARPTGPSPRSGSTTTRRAPAASTTTA